jgi:predicted RNA-binding protein YlqC (UPF0109 family)
VSRASALVESVAKALADDPDRVRVIASEHRGTTLVELFMAPGDLGHVIGRQGRTAAAIRVLAALAAERDGNRVQVEFRDGPLADE